MNRYTIYCTPEQTKKALELGAPINKRYNRFEEFDECILDKPTAEEMIGWLQEQGVYVEITKSFIADYQSLVHDSHSTRFYDEYLSSRKEATLAAIDAALEYLSNEKIKH